jgi:hypothetical protein
LDENTDANFETAVDTLIGEFDEKKNTLGIDTKFAAIGALKVARDAKATALLSVDDNLDTAPEYDPAADGAPEPLEEDYVAAEEDLTW